MDNCINYKKIGERLKHFREETNQTQITLGKTIHYTPAYLSQIECGKARPSLEVLIPCCEHLGHDLSEFFSETGEPFVFTLPEDILSLLRRMDYQDRLSIYVMAEAFLKMNPPQKA